MYFFLFFFKFTLANSRSIKKQLVILSYLFLFYSKKLHFPESALCEFERVKPQLSQSFTRGAHPNSNSRPAVQTSNPLPSPILLGENILLAYVAPSSQVLMYAK